MRTRRTPLIAALFCLLSAFGLLACQDEQLPVAGDACRTIEDCGGVSRLACRTGACAELTCERSAGCPTGAACVSGYCQAPECLQDTDCASVGGQCFEGDCLQDLCADNADCRDDQVCAGQPPRCGAPPERCLDDQDCPAQTICRITTQRCVSTCQDDQGCDALEHCDGGICRARCDASAPLQDQRCEPGELCVESKCIMPQDCASKPDTEPCPIERPFRRPTDCVCVACLSDSDCDQSRQEACIEDACTYCAFSGVDQQVCIGVGLPYKAGCCVGCLEDDDCDLDQGQRCERGRCTNPTIQRCQSDIDCEPPARCDGTRCSSSSSLTPCQSQDQCPAGESCYADGRCKQSATSCQPTCPAPSRCVAEAQDSLGSCAGCASHCDQAGCPQGQRCWRPDAQADGICVDEVFAQSSCL